MKYAVVRCTDTHFDVHSEHPDLKEARIAFHQYSASLWNDPNLTKATVKIVDEQLDCVDNCREFIHKAVEVTNESE